MTNRKSYFIGAILISLIIINLFSVSAITGIIGNSKITLYPQVNGETYTEVYKTILVKNVNNIPINITLETNETGNGFLEIIDKNFILQPNEEKNAGFLVKVKDEGRYEGKINVFFYNIGEEKEKGIILSSDVIAIAEKIKENEILPEEVSNNITTNNSTADNIINNVGGNKNLGAILLSISTLVLLIVLMILMGTLSKKRGRKKGKK